MPAAKPAASAMFHALRSVNVEPELAYEAVEEARHQAGENVTEEIKAEMDIRLAEIKAEMNIRFGEINARLDVLASRMDTLQKVLWPLVIAISVALLSAVGGGLFTLFKSV